MILELLSIKFLFKILIVVAFIVVFVVKFFCKKNVSCNKAKERNLNVKDIFKSINFNTETSRSAPSHLSCNYANVDEKKLKVSSSKFVGFEKYDESFLNSLECELKEFVYDRISTLNYEDDKDTVAVEKWALSVSDFLSELNDLRSSKKLPESQYDALVAPLLEELNRLKFSIIDLDYYDRKFQKVVGVEIKDDLTEIKLKESVSWGVKREERILKKQEVIIYKPTLTKED